LARLVAKLRQKSEATPGEPRHLLTVHGLGYRLDP
jgi:DNA-binding response OmpR family regulator